MKICFRQKSMLNIISWSSIKILSYHENNTNGNNIYRNSFIKVYWVSVIFFKQKAEIKFDCFFLVSQKGEKGAKSEFVTKFARSIFMQKYLPHC